MMFSTAYLRGLIATIVLVVAYCVPATAQVRRGGTTPFLADAVHAVAAEHGMVVAQEKIAAGIGADVLRQGGNAVDAGIACALVQGVVDPLMCGIAGFGSCGIYMPSKKFHGYIDAHAPAPLGARPDMWANLIESEARDGYGFILRGRVNDIGYKSICAPANLKMYYEAHKEHGSLPWSRIVEPAIAWAESGWTVRPHVHYWWSDDGAFGRARIMSAPASPRPPARSIAGPTARPSEWATASSIATMARRSAPSPRAAPTSSIPAKSLGRSPRT